MSSNPLRAPPKPFIKREIKKENRAIPPAPKKVIDNPADYKEFPLKACTQQDIEDAKTHILKFQSKSLVDPVNKFTKPIRLHRKETKNLQYQLTRAEIEQRQRENAEMKRQEEEARLKYLEEREKNGPVKEVADMSKVAPEPEKTEEQKKLEKQEKLLAQIAPDGGARRNKNPFKKKTRQIRAVDETAKKLRYEEYYPWVMEDYDGKNTWVGSYEAGSSDAYVLLVPDGNGFKMIPADKVYRFTPRNRYSTLTLEEAEARMEKHNHVPRWLMKHLDENEQKLTRYERTKKKLKTVEGTGNTGEDGEQSRGRDSENDDLDFEEDFADDEEAPIVDGDEEENKESERKIKKEMRAANAMGLHEDEGEEDYDDLFESRKVDKEGKRLRKALNKTDLTGVYESDEDINPYLSESDLEMEKTDDEEIVKADLSKPVSPAPQTNPDGRSKSPTPSRSLKVKSVNKPIGVVVLSALPSVLVKFPRGEWNPNAKKRVVEQHSDDEERSHKRVKLEEPNSDQLQIPPQSPPKIKSEETNGEIPSDDLLSENDIIQIVTAEKVTAKELIHKLKSKLSRHPDNKTRIKVLVKKLLKNQDGYLILKDN